MIPFGPDGSMWPLGRLEKTVTQDFDSASLPTGWTLIGSGASQALSTEPGGGQALTSAAAEDSQVGLVGPTILLSQPRLRAVHVEVSFTGGAPAGKELVLGMLGGTTEAITAWTSGAFIRAVGGTTDATVIPTNIYTVPPTGAPQGRYCVYPINGPLGADYLHRIGVLVKVSDTSNREEHDAFLTVMGELGSARRYDSVLVNKGTVRPGIRWANKAGGVPLVRHVHQFTVTKWWE